MPEITFPLNIKQIISLYSNCKCQSYSRFGEVNKMSFNEVIEFCQSKSGCTHYDIANRRYLVVCNENENPGRVRWTYAHELGHILCGHFLNRTNRMNSNAISDDKVLEQEADAFAALLLCPYALFELLDIRSALDISKTFGVSCEAANNRWNEYKTKNYKYVNSLFAIELRNLFFVKRPLDEIVFDVPHNTVSIPVHHKFSYESSLFS